MNTEIPSEYEAVIREAVAQGHFNSPSDALKEALKLLRSAYLPQSSLNKHQQVALDLRNQLQAMAARHSSSTSMVDDSRESMYAERS